MPLDIRNSLALISQSFRRQLLAEMPHQVLCGFGNARWHMDDIDAAKDLLIDLDLINTPEGCFANQKFIYQYSQCPIVDGTIVSAIQNYLRCHVLRCASKCVGLLILPHKFGKSKIDLEENEYFLLFLILFNR